MALRLLLAARKSRKPQDSKDAENAAQYERQDHKAREWSEREGHVIIHATADTISSQTAPWKRRDLGPWMRDATKMAMYDGILISNVDRISRGTDEDFHWLENWAYVNKKIIMVAQSGGFQFPARSGPMGIVDKQLWQVFKETARREWEAIRDRHADTRQVIKANGGAIGLPPFGYIVVGTKLHKVFEIDPVWGPVAHESFKRISEGHTATSVAIWLTEQTGKTWRVKRVTDMIRRRTYLGSRDGFSFEPLVTEELWQQANNALASRSFVRKDKGGRRAEHGYSGLIFCECGQIYYHHQSTRDGNPVGEAKYRCSRGRRGKAGEAKCMIGAPKFDDINVMVDELMTKAATPEFVMVTTGGDHGRQMELQGLQDEMRAAMARMDMGEVQRLAACVSALQGRDVEPVSIEMRETGKTYGQVWQQGQLADRRALLGRLAHKVTVKTVDGEWKVVLEPL